MSGRFWECRCEIAGRDQRQGRPSVDVELVTLRAFHRDCVVVEAFGVRDAGELGTETGQAGRLRIDTLPARLDRNRAAATDTDIEMQPVLGRLALRHEVFRGEPARG